MPACRAYLRNSLSRLTSTRRLAESRDRQESESDQLSRVSPSPLLEFSSASPVGACGSAHFSNTLQSTRASTQSTLSVGRSSLRRLLESRTSPAAR
ncbi:hypothetical protein V5799_031202 [Amblyomma americanum]|uniref:Uncharacterized protein n=1 Tax=Amblyomma americanum TaxID=6943 RepID=A0AAQ4EL49_AMBAM